MRRNQARLQMLALGLLGLFGLLSLDLAPVQALMGGYLGDPLLEEAEAEAAEAPSAPLRRVDGPSLAVRGGSGDGAAACPACKPPAVIGVEAEAQDVAKAAEVAVQFASADVSDRKDLSDRMAFSGKLTSMWMDRPKRWSTLAAAGRDLHLDEGQLTSWRRTLDDARRDMDDLRHVPNQQGDTWHTVSGSILQAGGNLTKAAAEAKRLADFAQSTLRGGETYIAARTRIVASYEDRLRADLTPEQEPIFDAHDVGPLFDAVRVAQVRFLKVRPERVVTRLRVLRS